MCSSLFFACNEQDTDETGENQDKEYLGLATLEVHRNDVVCLTVKNKMMD